MPSRVDLHTHTTASDGTLEPAALLAKAAELEVHTLGISDHDSTAGYEAALLLQAQYPSVQLIPAIEINAEGEKACHLLGYGMDIQNTAFQKALAQFRAMRLDRARAMIKKLQEGGVSIDFETVRAHCKGESLGRPHIADALRAKGVVQTRQQAFERYLKKGGSAYVAGEAPSAQEAIALIRQAGGVPILAHPCFYTTENLLQDLAKVGLMGIEAYYPEHGKSLTKRYLELAESNGLIVTGGSDFHGPQTGRTTLACVDVPESVISALKDAQKRI